MSNAAFSSSARKERVLMPVPRRAEEAAREVELDVIDTVLDLLADRRDEAVRPVALEGVARGEEMAARGRQEVAGGEQARADVLARFEGALPRHVHVAVAAGRAQAGDARLGECGDQPVAEQGDLIGQGNVGERQVVGMDVHVPQARHQKAAFEVDGQGVVDLERRRVGPDLPDAAVLDQHARADGRLGRDAVDQRGVDEERAHGVDRVRSIIRRRCRPCRPTPSTCRLRTG